MIEYRVEVWDRLNTERLGILQTVYSLNRRRVLSGEETLTLGVLLSDPGLPHLTRGSVLRVQRVGSTEFSLWRYTSAQRERSPDDALSAAVNADALWMDAREGVLRDVQADGRVLTEFGLHGLTPAEWITDYVVPGYVGDAIGLAVGVIDPVDPLDLNFKETSPLAALRLLEAETDGELQFRLNAAGDTYLVDLLNRVGSTNGAELRYGKNVKGLARLEDETEVVTRLYARGENGLGLGDARWPISAINGNVLTMTVNPVWEDDALVGLFLRHGEASYQITSTDASAGTITVADATGLQPGDAPRIAEDAAGTYLTFIESPSARAAAGVRVGPLEADVPNVSNLLPNGDLTQWASGMPSGWTKLGVPLIAKNIDPLHAKEGGASAHATAAVDEGLLSAAVIVTQGSDPGRPYHAILAGVSILSGRVRMELRHSNGLTYPLEQQAQTTAEGIYITLTSYPVHAEELPSGTVRLAVVAHDGPAEFHLDAALVTRTIGEVQPRFLLEDGGRELWARAVNDLLARSAPKVEYQVDVADLYKVDPARFAFERLELGDDVRVRDPDIGQGTLRIVELSEDLLDIEHSRVAVALDAWSRPNNPWKPARRKPAPGTVGTVDPGTGPMPAVDVSGLLFEHDRPVMIDPQTGELIYGAPYAYLRIYTHVYPATGGLRVTITPNPATGSGSLVRDYDVMGIEGAHDFLLDNGSSPSTPEWPRDATNTVYTIAVTPHRRFSVGSVAGPAGVTVERVVQESDAIPDPTADQHAVTRAYADANYSGGTSDHGALTGLTDDDHPQYLLVAGDVMTGLLDMGGHRITGLGAATVGTDAVSRDYADTRYAAAGHLHDDRYELLGHTHPISEVTGLQTALDGKAPANHTHFSLSDVTDIGFDNTIPPWWQPGVLVVLDTGMMSNLSGGGIDDVLRWGTNGPYWGNPTPVATSAKYHWTGLHSFTQPITLGDDPSDGGVRAQLEYDYVTGRVELTIYDATNVPVALYWFGDSSSSFALAGHGHPEYAQLAASQTFSGTISFASNLRGTQATHDGYAHMDARVSGDTAAWHKFLRNQTGAATTYTPYFERWYDGAAYHDIGVRPSGTLHFDGNDVWHVGNFDPDTKANLGGATFTGLVTLGAGAVLSAGRILTFENPGVTNSATISNVGPLGGVASVLNIADALWVQEAGNLGIGTTDIEAWHAGFRALQLSAYSAIMARHSTGGSTGTFILDNAFYDGAWKYRTTNPAGRWDIGNGAHTFYVAPSGTADTAISWTTALNIANSGAATFTGSVAVAGVSNPSPYGGLVAGPFLGAVNGDRAIYLWNSGSSIKLDAYDYGVAAALDIEIGMNGGDVIVGGRLFKNG